MNIIVQRHIDNILKIKIDKTILSKIGVKIWTEVLFYLLTNTIHLRAIQEESLDSYFKEN
jgi:hypothetical protein